MVRIESIIVLLLSLVFTSFAADPVKDLKDGGREIGQEFKKIGRQTEQAFKEGGQEFGQTFREGGKEIGQGARKVGKETGQAFKDKGRETLITASVYSNSRKRPPAFTLRRFRLKNENC